MNNELKGGGVVKQLDELIFHFIQEEKLFVPGAKVLVACSGGVDSIVLLHFLVINRKRLGIEVSAVHVDHMLRGEESAQDGMLVSKLCESLGIPFHGGRVPVPDLIEQMGGNVQAVCREGRYAYFSKVMREYGYGLLATAHHAEDQLETVLMEVTKGSIPSGIPVKREIEHGILIRPFLPVIKRTLYTYAKENQLAFNEDPSNESDAYMRNRVRRHIVPHILKENVTAPEKVVSMTRQLQEDEALLQTLAKERVEKLIEYTEAGHLTVSRQSFIDMPTALQRRAIPLLLGYLYDDKNNFIHYKFSLIEQILHHLNSQDGNVSIDLPLSYQFLREYDKLTFIKERKTPDVNLRKVIPKGVRTDWLNGRWFYWSNADDLGQDLLTNAKDFMYFDLPQESLPLYIRQRKEGDRIVLPGMDHPKRLSRLFIDEKVSRTERDCLPVVVTKQEEVYAVPPLRYGRAFTKEKTPTNKYIFVMGEDN